MEFRYSPTSVSSDYYTFHSATQKKFHNLVIEITTNRQTWGKNTWEYGDADWETLQEHSSPKEKTESALNQKFNSKDFTMPGAYLVLESEWHNTEYLNTDYNLYYRWELQGSSPKYFRLLERQSDRPLSTGPLPRCPNSQGRRSQELAQGGRDPSSF